MLELIRLRHLSMCLAVLGLQGVSLLQAHAAPLCIPPPALVPREVGPPDWWSEAGRDDDPRWRGAITVGHVGGHARSRILHGKVGDQEYLYLRFDLLLDGAASDSPRDSIDFGFVVPQAEATGPGTAFRITLPTHETASKQVIAPHQAMVRWKLASGVSWSDPIVTSAKPVPWIQETGRYWVNCDGPRCPYTVQLRVPIAASAAPNQPAEGLALPDQFRFWYAIRGGTAPNREVVHALPQEHEFKEVNFDSPSYPAPGQWADVQIRSTTACLPGIALAADDVFVTHAGTDPTATIGLSNVFHARPRNDTGGAMPGNALRARFRIADWGSAAVGDDPQWNDVPGCTEATGSGVVADGARWDLRCTWNLTPEQLCQYRPTGAKGERPPWSACATPGIKNSHQCVLVDLSTGPSGVQTFFSEPSVYNNFTIHHASTATDTAILSFSDIDDVRGKYAFLLVETANMPTRYDPRFKRDLQALKRANEPLPKAGFTRALERKLLRGDVTHAQLRREVPTLIVHAWVDTGDIHADADGRKLQRIAARPSFAMYLHHVGDLEGWQHRLDAPGLRQIAPAYYRVPIPASKRIELRLGVQAVTQDEPKLVANELLALSASETAQESARWRLDRVVPQAVTTVEPPAPAPAPAIHPRPLVHVRGGCAACHVGANEPVRGLASMIFGMAWLFRRRRRSAAPCRAVSDV